MARIFLKQQKISLGKNGAYIFETGCINFMLSLQKLMYCVKNYELTSFALGSI
jgi:hypothetical protein